MAQPRTAAEWGEAYRRLRPTYEAAAEKLRLLICDLLESSGISVIQTEARAKDVDSFVGKIQEKRDKYKKPLEEITDLAGVRVIAYYLEDVEAIGALIEEQFDVDAERSIRKGGEFDPDRFGYVSDHFIVRLKPPRSELEEWGAYSQLVAEFQVRTATQHAWAAIEHRLGYKSAKQLPPELRRRLYRLSALFELADDQFSGVRAAAEQLQQSYGETLREGDLSVPLDLASLKAYMEGSSRVAALLETFVEAGGMLKGPPPDDEDRSRQQRDRSDLIKTLTSRDMRTIRELDEILAEVEKEPERLRMYVKAQEEIQDPALAFPEDVINRCVFLALAASEKEIAAIYSATAAKAMRRAIEA